MAVAGSGLAESCSAGLLAARIADVPGSSAYFAGGWFAIQTRPRGISSGRPGPCSTSSARSRPRSRKRWRSVPERFDADVSVAITGIAGPDGGTGDKPVGLVHSTSDAEGGVRRQHRSSRRPSRRPRALGVGRHAPPAGNSGFNGSAERPASKSHTPAQDIHQMDGLAFVGRRVGPASSHNLPAQQKPMMVGLAPPMVTRMPSEWLSPFWHALCRNCCVVWYTFEDFSGRFQSVSCVPKVPSEAGLTVPETNLCSSVRAREDQRSAPSGRRRGE